MKQKLIAVLLAGVSAGLLLGPAPGVGITLLGIVYALLGAPLFCVIGLTTLISMYTLDAGEFSTFLGQGALQIIGAPVSKIAAEPLFLTIPLFTFAGYVLSEARTPKRLVELSQAMLGWLPGGFAVVAVATCAFFTAFTGASGVTIIALGGLLYPVLKAQKYPDRFNLGLLTTCGSLGLLFPPSLPLILYAVIATLSGRALSGGQVEVQELFIAGIVPGVLLVLIMGARGIWVGFKQKVPTTRLSLRKIVRALLISSLEIAIPFIILYLIFAGICTPSEVAGVVALYVVVIECFVYRDVKLRALPRLIKDSMVLVGGITIILMMATAMTGVLVLQEVPQKILANIEGLFSSPWTFLLALNGFLLIVGCLMDIFSAILVVVPLLILPAARFGVDPYLLGVVFLTNLEIGYSTPPVGMNLFIASLRFKKPIWTLYRASLGFLGLLLIGLAAITYVPDLTLWLIMSPPEEISLEERRGALTISWKPVDHAIGYELELLDEDGIVLEVDTGDGPETRLAVGKERRKVLVAAGAPGAAELVALLEDSGYSARLADSPEAVAAAVGDDWAGLISDPSVPVDELTAMQLRAAAVLDLASRAESLSSEDGRAALLDALGAELRLKLAPGGAAPNRLVLEPAPEGVVGCRIRTIRGLGATLRDLAWGVRSDWAGNAPRATAKELIIRPRAAVTTVELPVELEGYNLAPVPFELQLGALRSSAGHTLAVERFQLGSADTTWSLTVDGATASATLPVRGASLELRLEVAGEQPPGTYLGSFELRARGLEGWRAEELPVTVVLEPQLILPRAVSERVRESGWFEAELALSVASLTGAEYPFALRMSGLYALGDAQIPGARVELLPEEGWSLGAGEDGLRGSLGASPRTLRVRIPIDEALPDGTYKGALSLRVEGSEGWIEEALDIRLRVRR